MGVGSGAQIVFQGQAFYSNNLPVGKQVDLGELEHICRQFLGGKKLKINKFPHLEISLIIIDFQKIQEK